MPLGQKDTIVDILNEWVFSQTKKHYKTSIDYYHVLYLLSWDWGVFKMSWAFKIRSTQIEAVNNRSQVCGVDYVACKDHKDFDSEDNEVYLVDDDLVCYALSWFLHMGLKWLY